jgi:hypothetical protein
MIRILSCLAITIAMAFWMMSMGATPGIERYDILQLVAVGNLAIGIGVLLVGFTTLTFAGEDVRNKKLAEHGVIFGTLIAGFGLGILPLVPEKVIILPLCVAISFALARISLKAFQATSDAGSAGTWSVMQMTCGGFASIWALASGWTWVQAGSLLLACFIASCAIAFVRPARSGPLPVTG